MKKIDMSGKTVEEYSKNMDKRTLLISKNSDASPDWNWDFKYQKSGDVGIDVPVYVHGVRFIKGYDGKIKDGEWFDIPPGSTAEIPTGYNVKVPDDSWGNIRARSSTGFKMGLIVLEGVIDSGYVGPMFALVHNPTGHAVRITQGMRLAQLVLIPKYFPDSIFIVDKLPTTERGETGFGSSGN